MFLNQLSSSMSVIEIYCLHYDRVSSPTNAGVWESWVWRGLYEDCWTHTFFPHRCHCYAAIPAAEPHKHLILLLLFPFVWGSQPHRAAGSMTFSWQFFQAPKWFVVCQSEYEWTNQNPLIRKRWSYTHGLVVMVKRIYQLDACVIFVNRQQNRLIPLTGRLGSP